MLTSKRYKYFLWGYRDVYKAFNDDDVITRKLVIQQEERVSPIFIPDVPGLVPEKLFGGVCMTCCFAVFHF